MDNDNKERNEEVEKKEKKQQKLRFNAGGNDSDYDGGHPGGFSVEDEERSAAEDEGGGSFNAGGNDSDFDGGHPGEKFPSKK